MPRLHLHTSLCNIPICPWRITLLLLLLLLVKTIPALWEVLINKEPGSCNICQERFCKTDTHSWRINRATWARQIPKMETQQVSAEDPSTGPDCSFWAVFNSCLLTQNKVMPCRSHNHNSSQTKNSLAAPHFVLRLPAIKLSPSRSKGESRTFPGRVLN